MRFENKLGKFKSFLASTDKRFQPIFQGRKDSNPMALPNCHGLLSDKLLSIVEDRWGQKSTVNQRIDSEYTLQLYNQSVDIDKRIIRQLVEKSMLRSSFLNYPNERIFHEFAGVDRSKMTYMVPLVGSTGSTANLTPGDESLTPRGNMDYPTDSSMEYVQVYTSEIHRRIKNFAQTFRVSINELDIAAASNIPIQDIGISTVARNLGMQEQHYAFNENLPGQPAYTQGLFHQNLKTIAWQGPGLLTPGAKGADIQAEFNRIRAVLRGGWKGIYQNEPLCFLTSIDNAYGLQRPFSDLQSQPVWDTLTNTYQFRIGGISSISDPSIGYMYINDPEVVELSTAGAPFAAPSGWTVSTLSYEFPYLLFTAGITVKRPEFFYKITGLNGTPP